MSTGTGINVTKAVAYAVITASSGLAVSKANAYGVLASPTGVNVSKTQAYAVLVIPNTNPPVWPASLVLPNGVLGNPYSAQWDLSPAAAPTTYSLQSGTLPPGLTLSGPAGSNIGVLSGTPTLVGTFTFTLLATNAYGAASQSFTVTIIRPAYVNVYVEDIASATLSHAYSESVTASGGATPYTFTLLSGSLPPGITLSTAGVLSGIPTSTGTYTFTVEATDADGFTGQQTFRLSCFRKSGSNAGFAS